MPIGSTCALTPSLRGRCTNDAYVISTDGRWRSAAGNYAAVWQAVATTLRNGPARYQPDGKDIVPGRWAPGGSLYVGKEGGAHWLWSSWQHLAGQTLDFNDVGYLERKNDWQSYWALRYRTLAATRFTAETTTSLNLNLRTTLDGVNLWNELALGTSAILRNFWTVFFNVHGRGAYFDDRETGDGTALQRPASLGAIARDRIRSAAPADGVAVLDLRRPARRRRHLRPERDAVAAGAVAAGAGVHPDRRLRDRRAALLREGRAGAHDAAGPAARRHVSVRDADRGQRGRDGARRLHLHARAVAAALHAAFPGARPLRPAVHGDAAGRWLGPHLRPAALHPALPVPPPNPDTARATFNVNLVLRWEYRLGSTLFVVYTRSQDPRAPNGATFELRPLYQGRAADNVLMVKLAYWFG